MNIIEWMDKVEALLNSSSIFGLPSWKWGEFYYSDATPEEAIEAYFAETKKV